MRVTESIHVNHELDMLEAHIIEASKYADRIVCKEGAATWNGVPKPLHVSDNWERFEKYPKAEVMVIPAEEFVVPEDITGTRKNECKTRTYGWQEVSKDADYVIECDVDEILDVSKIGPMWANMEKLEYLHFAVRYANHLWFMNNFLKHHIEYRIFKTGEPEICLMPKGRHRTGSDGQVGWHFSGCVPAEQGWERKYADMNWIYGLSPAEIEKYDWNDLRARGLFVNKQRELIPLAGERRLEVELGYYPDFVQTDHEKFPWFGDVRFV